MNGQYRKQTFDNGLVLVTEKLPYLRSVAVGFWVKAGSRSEPPQINGMAHFLEHMAFKGTQRRTTQEIAHLIDTLGGHLDAFTTREHTCFYVKVLDEQLPQALDLLTDMLFYSKLSMEDINLERQVIMEEINMVEDTPEDNIHDLASSVCWPGNPLGQPILGTVQSLTAIGRSQIVDFYNSYYRPDQMLLSVAGNIEHETIADWVNQHIAGRSAGVYPPPLSSGNKPEFNTHCVAYPKDLEQVHVCIGTLGLAQNHPSRYAEYVLNTILGTGTSSRLFQEVREKRGLAYNVYSGFNSYSDTGMGEIYAATSPQSYPEVIGLIARQLAELKQGEVPADELQKSKDHLKSSLVLGLENTSSRMMAQAKFELYFGRNLSLDEMLAGIDRVRADEVLVLAQNLFDKKYLSLVTLGPLEQSQVNLDSLEMKV